MPGVRLAIATLAVAGLTALPSAASDKPYPWDHRPRKCFEPAPAKPDPSFASHCKAPGWTDFEQAKRNFVRLFIDPDFDLVERASNELGFSLERFPTGEYRFEALYEAMVVRFQYSSSIGEHLAMGWMHAKGPGGYAKVAEALVQYGRGWDVRGRKDPRIVSPEAWELFYGKLEEAYATLDSASPKIKQTAPWHSLRLSIAFQHPKLKVDRLKALRAASAAWPDHLPVYTIPMELMHPNRGGSFELMEAVGQFALEKTRASHGAAIYALVYERIFRKDGKFTVADSMADWGTLKQGFRDLEARRIGQPSTWKNLAALACQARDRPEARRLYSLYDNARNTMTPENPDPCRTFAETPSDAKDAPLLDGTRRRSRDWKLE